MPADGEFAAMVCPRCGGNLPPTAAEYVVCQYCGSSLVRQAAAKSPGADAPGRREWLRGYRLKTISCKDEAGTGLELFNMLAPVGWSFRGGCRWLLDNPGMPAVVSFQVANPQGAEAFEVLPNMNFTWSGGAMRGTRHFGAEVYPPVSIRDALRQFVLPRYRSAYSDLRILREEAQPDLPRLAKSDAAVSPIGRAEGGRIRVGYSWQGWQFEEEIYGVVEVFRTMISGMFGPSEFFVWFIDYLFSFRAAAGKLDCMADLFSVMIGSFRLNPQWYAAMKTVAQVMAQQQIERIHHIGQIGEMIARAGSQMREQNLSDWYARQATYDRLATDRSRQIRDVDAFIDPNREEVVELPAGYGHAWANNLGEYILTEEANFNPNESSTQQWVEMAEAN
jgi:hypothetical protein